MDGTTNAFIDLSNMARGLAEWNVVVRQRELNEWIAQNDPVWRELGESERLEISRWAAQFRIFDELWELQQANEMRQRRRAFVAVNSEGG